MVKVSGMRASRATVDRTCCVETRRGDGNSVGITRLGVEVLVCISRSVILRTVAGRLLDLRAGTNRQGERADSRCGLGFQA
jgi:hypothetical protein